MKYCADCCEMDTIQTKKGLFKCSNCRKSGYNEVSARQIACNSFKEAFNSRRSETDRERLMQISRDHGYYITTFIVESLDLEDKQDYLDAFAYVKDEVMPEIDSSWVEDYDTYGPIVAERLGKEENSYDIALSLFQEYLSPFKEMIFEGKTIDAIKLYDKMYQELKHFYGIGTQEKPYEPKLS